MGGHNDNQRWERLLVWLKEQHGMHVGSDDLLVECKDVEGAGRGLFARKACTPSSTLFKVPAGALLNADTLAVIYPQARARKLTATQIVSLHLFLHRPQHDSDSLDPSFGPYISTLPRDFSSHPLSWMIKRKLGEGNSAEAWLLNSLPPTVLLSLKQLQTRLWTDWNANCNFINDEPAILNLSSRSDFTSPCLNLRDSNAIMDYVWAWLNVNTRCIFYRVRAARSDPDNLTLCPILEMANHFWGQTHISPVIDSELWDVRARKKKDFVFLSCADAPIEQGQELLLHYGSHSNKTLFVEYGFVNRISRNAFATGKYDGELDVQDLVEKMFVDRGSLGSWMKTVLEDEGYWGDWTLHSSPARPSYRLIVALRLYNVFEGISSVPVEPNASLITWRDVLKGHAYTISQDNEAKWRGSVLRICDSVIERADGRMHNLKASCSEGQGWLDWMEDNIRILWMEESEVARAVADSIRAGDEF